MSDRDLPDPSLLAVALGQQRIKVRPVVEWLGRDDPNQTCQRLEYVARGVYRLASELACVISMEASMPDQINSLIVGETSGISREIRFVLARRGEEVLPLGRDR